MTKNQYEKLKERFPNSPYDPKFAALVDKEVIDMTNASIAIQLPVEDQMRFRYHAANFSQRQFASAVAWWKRMSDDRRTLMRQILDDIDCAFEEWDAWTGNRATVEEQDDFQQMVVAARMRVLAFLCGLKVTLPRKDE